MPPVSDTTGCRAGAWPSAGPARRDTSAIATEPHLCGAVMEGLTSHLLLAPSRLASGRLRPDRLPDSISAFIEYHVPEMAAPCGLAVERCVEVDVVVAQHRRVVVQPDRHVARLPDPIIQLPGLDLAEVRLSGEFGAIGCDELEVFGGELASYLHVGIHERLNALVLDAAKLIGGMDLFRAPGTGED